MISIRQAQFPHDTDDVLEIWQEYVQSPSVSLDYQNYEDEFANLPGNYGAPSGAILLGELRGKTAGCVAMRRVCDGICEMKRLYVRPAARGFGLGRTLTKSLIFQAKASGYFEMRLDVLSEFEAAQKLYSELGFKPAEPVSYNPIPGTKYLGLLLT